MRHLKSPMRKVQAQSQFGTDAMQNSDNGQGEGPGQVDHGGPSQALSPARGEDEEPVEGHDDAAAEDEEEEEEETLPSGSDDEEPKPRRRVVGKGIIRSILFILKYAKLVFAGFYIYFIQKCNFNV